MKNKTKIIIGIIIAAIAIPIGIYSISPLFINTEINEPIPSLANEKPTSDPEDSEEVFENFMALTANEKIAATTNMTEEKKGQIINLAAKRNTTINEPMTTMAMVDINKNKANENPLTGKFSGVGDGIHNVEGVAKILTLSDGSQILRLEDFKSTNGPDVHLYLSTDKQASDFIDLGSLKANIGNQNYQIPSGIDFNKYNYVLIWCQPFSVLFGSTQLSSS